MKLRAFTLLELLVGLVLSGIVAGVSFTAYQVMAGRLAAYRSTNEAISEATWLSGRLGKEIEKAESLTGNSTELLLRMENGRSIRYDFAGAYVVRHDSLLTDTFFVSTGHLEPEPEGGPLVSRVQFRAEIGGEPELFIFSKDYAADKRLLLESSSTR